VEGEFDEEWLVWVEARVTFKNEHLGFRGPSQVDRAYRGCHHMQAISKQFLEDVTRVSFEG